MKKIMIIDDDTTSLETTAGQLRKFDFEVETTNTAKNIEEAIKNFAPDCIIMDLMMPDVDGNQAVDRLQKDGELKNIPVIFLTALDARDQESGVEFEITVNDKSYRTLIKPIDTQTLVDEIKKIV